MARVFVYGTLKKGQPNNYRMLDGANGRAHFLSSAVTEHKYPLVIATEYNIPFLLDLPGRGRRVHGEIYEVDQSMLDFLDDFESVPRMYQRNVIRLELTREGGERAAPGAVVEAFVYSTATYQSDWTTRPCYENYNSHGDHGLEYQIREARDRDAER